MTTDDTNTAPPSGTGSELVQRFAAEFLPADAQQRLANPKDATYERLFETETPEFSDTDWGQFLVEEIVHFSKLGVWLDWKNNVLALMLNEDPGFDNMLNQVFEMNGLPGVTEAEREAVLADVVIKPGKQLREMMLPRLQDLATSRGARLMVIENDSDGLLLTALPGTASLTWHLTQLGDVLLVDASHPEVADPRRNGEHTRLFS